jgi:hypothetical protein
LADGTTASMPDTPENQAEYPQHVAQKPGLGFPIVRLVLLTSLATAMVGDVALQTIAASLGMLACATDELAARLIAAQLTSLTEQTVGDRPNRVEPRAVKRRPQPLALLTKPRHEARAELLRGTRT